MKILLSPAKRLNETSKVNWKQATSPLFLGEAEILIQEMQKKSSQEIQSLMKISEDLAQLNKERYQNWKTNPKESETTPAALLFDGEVYRGLQSETWDEALINYSKNHILILSGLYGVLRPTDLILPYRLEMGTKLETQKAQNLHQFWKEKLTSYLSEQLSENEIILNLASKEYTDSLDLKRWKENVIDVKFKEYRDGKLKQIMVYFKQSRGQMARFCLENQINSVEELKAFDQMNYRFDENLSTKNTLVFTR